MRLLRLTLVVTDEPESDRCSEGARYEDGQDG